MGELCCYITEVILGSPLCFAVDIENIDVKKMFLKFTTNGLVRLPTLALQKHVTFIRRRTHRANSNE